MTGPELLGSINAFLSAISPIAVCFITVYFSAKAKKDKKIKALQSQIDAETENKRQRQLKEMQDTILQLTEEVKKLRKEYDSSKIEKQFSQLRVLNEFNFEYIQSLSNVVISIGDTIVNSSLVDDKKSNRIGDTIAEFKDKESALTKKLYTSIS